MMETESNQREPASSDESAMEDSTTSPRIGPLGLDHHRDHSHGIDHNEESPPLSSSISNSDSRLHTSRTIQIPIRESWITAFHTVAEAIEEIYIDFLDFFRKPIFMDSTTLFCVSILLLLIDRFFVWLARMIETLLLVPAATATSTSTAMAWQNKVQHIAMVWEKRLDGMARLFLTSDVGFFLNGTAGFFLNGSESSNSSNYDPSSSITGHFLVLATALAIMANTSYFAMLSRPLNNHIMNYLSTSSSATSSSAFSTEVLLGVLIFLFGIEVLTVLSFFLLGYKVLLSSPNVSNGALLQNAMTALHGGGGLRFSTTGNAALESDTNLQIDDETGATINLLLFLSTAVWIFCVLTSTIVRLALYRSMGD